MTDIRERFWTWWFDGMPQPVADRMFKRVVNEEVHKLADGLADESRELRKALNAAQDEIEARILASERDRELIRQLGVVVEHMAPAAYKAIMANGGANDDAPGDES